MSLSRSISLLMLVAGCATTVPMQRSPMVPSTNAELKVVDRKGGNTSFRIEAEHLAPPERLAPNAKRYVVWVRPSAGEESPQNVGALSLDEEEYGELTTITPFERFEAFITPEPTGNATLPTGPKVLWSSLK